MARKFKLRLRGEGKPQVTQSYYGEVTSNGETVHFPASHGSFISNDGETVHVPSPRGSRR